MYFLAVLLFFCSTESRDGERALGVATTDYIYTFETQVGMTLTELFLMLITAIT